MRHILAAIIFSCICTPLFADLGLNDSNVPGVTINSASFSLAESYHPFEAVMKPLVSETPEASTPARLALGADSDVQSETESPVAAAPADSVVSPWDFGGWLTLNGTQASFRNWSQGGVNNITATGTSRFTAEYKKDRFIFNNTTNLKYGKARIEGNEYRKTDDEIRFRNQLRYLLDDPRFSLIAQVNFNTQFDKGYDSQNVNVISRFMSPAYIIETIGFAFNPDRNLQADMGISLRQTIVTDETLRARYGLKPDEKIRNEGGISLGLKFDRDIMTNVNLVTQIETFTNYLKPLNSTTIRVTNELVGKINSYLSANFQLVLVYDDNITRELQVKQVLSIGFSYRIL